MLDFIEDVLLKNTRGSVFICSLANSKDGQGPSERHTLTRNLEDVETFVKKWDQAGRGLYLCVSTLKERSRRIKSNALETAFLHVDIDPQDVDVPLDQVTEVLLSLPMVPSYVVSSGRGLHAYWCLSEPVTSSDDVEDSLRDLADVVAGDRKVAHRVALMRLPGTHNTKDGRWTPVEVTHRMGSRYSYEDLQSWLATATAAIQRKAGPPQGPAEQNPYVAYAESVAFRAPIDVEKRLSAMQFRGPGDTAVHATQLSVTASMLSAGTAVEEVVQTVLEATRKVAPADWDWKKEEQTVRGMCRDWLKKMVSAEEAQDQSAASPDGKVISLADKRAERDLDKQNQKSSVKKSTVHVVLGNGFLSDLKRRGDGVLVEGEQVWACAGGLWRSLTIGEARNWIDSELESGCRVLGVTSTQKIIAEGRAWLMRNPDLQVQDVPWDDHGKIATRSGLVDPVTLQLSPVRVEDYVTRRIECEYDPSAECPRWEKMINDCFPDDPGSVTAIQEILGTALLADRPRSLMRALVLVGPSNSGKSNLLTALVGLLSDRPNTTTFDLLENAHGLMNFLRPVPWLLHEAFEQSKWHFSSIVKALLSGDPVSVNVKNGPILTCRFKSPVFWGTNSPPQFKEASKAIENRLKIIRCQTLFDTEVATGVAAEARAAGYSSPADFILDTEKSGMLNWAIVGMRRAVERGFLFETEDMKASAHAMRVDTNLVAGFMEDAVEFDPGTMVSKPDFNAAFGVWWKENKGETHHTPSEDSIGRAVSALYDPRIAMDKQKLKYKNVRYYAGVKLNDMGMDLWTANYNASAVRGDTARISSSPAEVNKLIPPEWSDRDIIKHMTAAHRKGRGA